MSNKKSTIVANAIVSDFNVRIRVRAAASDVGQLKVDDGFDTLLAYQKVADGSYKECLYLFTDAIGTPAKIADGDSYILVDTARMRDINSLDARAFIEERVRIFLGGGGVEPPPVKSYP